MSDGPKLTGVRPVSPAKPGLVRWGTPTDTSDRCNSESLVSAGVSHLTRACGADRPSLAARDRYRVLAALHRAQ